MCTHFSDDQDELFTQRAARRRRDRAAAIIITLAGPSRPKKSKKKKYFKKGHGRHIVRPTKSIPVQLRRCKYRLLTRLICIQTFCLRDVFFFFLLSIFRVEIKYAPIFTHAS